MNLNKNNNEKNKAEKGNGFFGFPNPFPFGHSYSSIESVPTVHTKSIIETIYKTFTALHRAIAYKNAIAQEIIGQFGSGKTFSAYAVKKSLDEQDFRSFSDRSKEVSTETDENVIKTLEGSKIISIIRPMVLPLGSLVATLGEEIKREVELRYPEYLNKVEEIYKKYIADGFKDVGSECAKFINEITEKTDLILNITIDEAETILISITKVYTLERKEKLLREFRNFLDDLKGPILVRMNLTPQARSEIADLHDAMTSRFNPLYRIVLISLSRFDAIEMVKEYLRYVRSPRKGKELDPFAEEAIKTIWEYQSPDENLNCNIPRDFVRVCAEVFYQAELAKIKEINSQFVKTILKQWLKAPKEIKKEDQRKIDSVISQVAQVDEHATIEHFLDLWEKNDKNQISELLKAIENLCSPNNLFDGKTSKKKIVSSSSEFGLIVFDKLVNKIYPDLGGPAIIIINPANKRKLRKPDFDEIQNLINKRKKLSLIYFFDAGIENISEDPDFIKFLETPLKKEHPIGPKIGSIFIRFPITRATARLLYSLNLDEIKTNPSVHKNLIDSINSLINFNGQTKNVMNKLSRAGWIIQSLDSRIWQTYVLACKEFLSVDSFNPDEILEAAKEAGVKRTRGLAHYTGYLRTLAELGYINRVDSGYKIGNNLLSAENFILNLLKNTGDKIFPISSLRNFFPMNSPSDLKYYIQSMIKKGLLKSISDGKSIQYTNPKMKKNEIINKLNELIKKIENIKGTDDVLEKLDQLKIDSEKIDETDDTSLLRLSKKLGLAQKLDENVQNKLNNWNKEINITRERREKLVPYLQIAKEELKEKLKEIISNIDSLILLTPSINYEDLENLRDQNDEIEFNIRTIEEKLQMLEDQSELMSKLEKKMNRWQNEAKPILSQKNLPPALLNDIKNELTEREKFKEDIVILIEKNQLTQANDLIDQHFIIENSPRERLKRYFVDKIENLQTKIVLLKEIYEILSQSNPIAQAFQSYIRTVMKPEIRTLITRLDRFENNLRNTDFQVSVEIQDFQEKSKNSVNKLIEEIKGFLEDILFPELDKSNDLDDSIQIVTGTLKVPNEEDSLKIIHLIHKLGIHKFKIRGSSV